MRDLEDNVKTKISHLTNRGSETEKDILVYQERVEKLRELITSYTLKGSKNENESRDMKRANRKGKVALKQKRHLTRTFNY